MDGTLLTPMPVRLVVDLVNEFSDNTREAAGEQADEYLVPEGLASGELLVADLAELANILYPIFTSTAEAVALLNQLADRYHLSHRLNPAGQMAWYAPPSRQAEAVAGLLDLVADRGLSALGVCHGSNCVDVFIDTSQAHNRHYCSSKCNTRARVARWRTRQDD